MDVLVMALTFATAIIVSGCLVWFFAVPMDGVLSRLISGEMSTAWSLYAKFALFVTTLTGGLRLGEIQTYAGEGGPPVDASQCILEVYRTIAGSLGAASWVLLVFFGATLAAYLLIQGYASLKPSLVQRREEEHRPGVPAGRY